MREFKTLKNKFIRLRDNLVLLDKYIVLTSSRKNYGRISQLAFTEKDLCMVATILKSKRALNVIFAIIETFAKLVEVSRRLKNNRNI